MKGRLKKRLSRLAMLAGGLALMVAAATCTARPPLGEGVVRRAATVSLNGVLVDVDFYFRADGKARPGVVVAHGFMRSRRHMAGWGAALAERGMVAAVLTQPFLAKHGKNAEAIAKLAEAGRLQQWPVPLDGKVGLMGFSMGGLTTLMAAERASPPVAVWVGLDPVDFEGKGAEVAGRVKVPGLALLAEPAPFNREGNGRRMLAGYGGRMEVWRVKGATHCDAESQTDWLGQLACGRVDEERQAVFQRSAAGFLAAELLGEERPALGDEAMLEPVKAGTSGR